MVGIVVFAVKLSAMHAWTLKSRMRLGRLRMAEVSSIYAVVVIKKR